MKDIELEIEGLVLHGFRSGDPHQIREAVESVLTLLLAEKGLP